MPDAGHLKFGPLTDRCVHLCVDMQRLYGERMDWHTPWLERVLPIVERITAARPERTILPASCRARRLARDPAPGGAITSAGRR